MYIARNAKQTDTSYIITPDRPDIKFDPTTNEVTFESSAKGTTYIKYWKPADFERSHPHLALKPGEGPYQLNVGLSRDPAVFAGRPATAT